MKIMTILGTRPEIIRLSRIIPLLDESCRHVLVHTGQNYDERLHDIFFRELRLRKPDHQLESKAPSPMEEVGRILRETERVLRAERPDRLLILGDTNSALSAFVAKRMGIPVFHMEAGNRCCDDRVPEEVNRRVVDHCSDVLMPYTERSRANLLREGIRAERIFVTGNPIREILEHYGPEIASSGVLARLGLAPRGYFLVTLHRAENVDCEERLAAFLRAFQAIHEKHRLPLVCTVHPRLRDRLSKSSQKLEQEGILAIDPLGLFDFVHMERNAFCVLSDSGTVQEECCIFGIPNVTIRDVTERPETLEVGSNVLSGADADSILRCVEIAAHRTESDWSPPVEYMAKNVSRTVAKIVLGYVHGR